MAMGDETLPNGGKAPGEGVWGILKAFMCIGYRLCAFLLCGSLRVLMQHFMQISSKPFFPLCALSTIRWSSSIKCLYWSPLIQSQDHDFNQSKTITA